MTARKARLKADSFERLLAKARKNGLSTRKAWHYTKPHKCNPKSNEEKAIEKAARDAKKKTYSERLQECMGQVYRMAEGLAEEFGKHDAGYYYTEIMQVHRLTEKKKDPNAFQAFVSMRVEEINKDIPEGENRRKVGECITDIAKEWNELSTEEKKERTADALASHNTPLAVFHDTRSTLEEVKLVLQRLNSRTGCEALLIAVRSNSGHYNPADSWGTSPRVLEFFNISYREQTDKMAHRLEGYCVSGLEGVAHNYQRELSGMKSGVVNLILSKLKEAGGKTKISRMFYSNFDEHITARYGIIIKGWPLNRFCSPSDLNTRSEVDILRNAWENNTCTFYKMTETEWKEWEKKRFEEKVAESSAQTTPGDVHDTGSEPPPNNDAGCEPARPSGSSPGATSTSPPEDAPASSANGPEPLPSCQQVLTQQTPLQQIQPPALPVDQSQPKRRGRKPKEGGQVANATFVNSSAIIGANGEVTMNVPKRKTRKDKGEARKKQRTSTGEEGLTVSRPT
ncbi:hypothetical protein D9758_011357 [Tetrapyrgos nigripes]|uniref:Uncharacterized protein n=1 Tax=Tetrapyrgos nigripes TaxID=182062 RepID=A0A8H5LK07_9AGAR|nr:hypothetical protein D9758_011357 [Tetrapyrgos nigripes]